MGGGEQIRKGKRIEHGGGGITTTLPLVPPSPSHHRYQQDKAASLRASSTDSMGDDNPSTRPQSMSEHTPSMSTVPTASFLGLSLPYPPIPDTTMRLRTSPLSPHSSLICSCRVVGAVVYPEQTPTISYIQYIHNNAVVSTLFSIYPIQLHQFNLPHSIQSI
jgi:hypothetical protein